MWCSSYLFSIWHWVARKINWRTTNNNLDELSGHEPDEKQVIIELLYEYDD